MRIHAAAINPTDLTTRRAPRDSMPGLTPPFVLGWDLAGVVAAVGAGVTEFAPGDRVVGMIPFGRIGGRVGAYAEAAAVDASWLAPLAANVNFETAATLPLNVLTAHQALAFFDLPPGARLLVTGASGGVGGYATQLAVRAGLYVVAVAGRDDEAWVASLGAAEVLPRDADLGAIATVDGVLDAAPVGPARATAPLRDGGTAVFARVPDPRTSERVRIEHVTVQADPPTLRAMARLLNEGQLRTRVSRVLPLDQAAEGHRLVQAGGLRGKVVLKPPQGAGSS